MPAHKKDIDEKKVAALAFDGASNRDIAAILGVDESTIRERFPAILNKKRAERRMKIRRAQMRSVESKNVAMQIWLGKQELDQVDKLIQQTAESGVQVTIKRVVHARED